MDTNLEVYTSILYYCTFGLEAANDAQNVRADTTRRKDIDQQNISTRSSADADNRLNAFSGQSRSTNMVPFHM